MSTIKDNKDELICTKFCPDMTTLLNCLYINCRRHKYVSDVPLPKRKTLDNFWKPIAQYILDSNPEILEDTFTLDRVVQILKYKRAVILDIFNSSKEPTKTGIKLSVYPDTKFFRDENADYFGIPFFVHDISPLGSLK